MSTPTLLRVMQNLFRQIHKMTRTLTKGLISWLLRGLLVAGGNPFASRAGFVLPTTVLLLLVVTLTVGAISYRTFTRSQQVIGERQQRVIYNAATPAIDRAKAKIEFMFNSRRDRRFGGVPSENQLLGMMLNDGTNGVPRFPADGPDPYTFAPSGGSSLEERIDINEDGAVDNAWIYSVDQNGNGSFDDPQDVKVAYSIIFTAPDAEDLTDTRAAEIVDRAEDLVVRNAPLSNAVQTNSLCRRDTGDEESAIPVVSESGWFADTGNDSTLLRKNFQINAYVLPMVIRLLLTRIAPSPPWNYSKIDRRFKGSNGQPGFAVT
ncbi:MAG: hypothetical protein HC769_09725 [Cyanobacteria bacterium CRU_2_1]|nr:hypothetical protein [Cyanobacteria bacterium RU_5_0]NJR59093.1 hypothetical protein [Cyanobacteria bacterium CRU_2_1]